MAERFPIRILLNGLSVVYPISGVGQYTLQLGKALQHLLGSENIVWFGKDPFTLACDLWDVSSASYIHRLQHGFKEQLRKIPNLNVWVHRWRNVRFTSVVRRTKPSLYHETRYALFDFNEGPIVTSIYDLSFMRHPEWHPIDRVRHFEKFCLKKLCQVEAVITISEFSKKEMVSLLNTDPARIHVTPLGVDHRFSPGEGRIAGLPDQYILYLGNLEPRKNLSMLVKTYQALPQELRDRYALVIAGAKTWHTHEMKKALAPFRRSERIILTGYVPQRWLPDLYRGASLFVYPSFYEGFGLPVLEAMASGVPVLASNAASLPEVAGDAGVLVNPCDEDAWREAMRELLEDEKKRKEMTEKGIARARLFSWEKCAHQTRSVYEKVLSKGV